MIIVYERNICDKLGAVHHESTRLTRTFDGCDLDQLKEYLLTEACNRLNLDIDKVIVLLAFKII